MSTIFGRSAGLDKPPGRDTPKTKANARHTAGTVKFDVRIAGNVVRQAQRGQLFCEINRPAGCHALGQALLFPAA